MNSSVKFFAPRTTGGLPLPGCPLRRAGVPDPEPERELFLSSEPHAVSAIASATVSSATIERYQVLLVISVPSRGCHVLVSAVPFSTPCRPRRARGVAYLWINAKTPSARNASADTRIDAAI